MVARSAGFASVFQVSLRSRSNCSAKYATGSNADADIALDEPPAALSRTPRVRAVGPAVK